MLKGSDNKDSVAQAHHTQQTRLPSTTDQAVVLLLGRAREMSGRTICGDFSPERHGTNSRRRFRSCIDVQTLHAPAGFRFASGFVCSPRRAASQSDGLGSTMRRDRGTAVLFFALVLALGMAPVATRGQGVAIQLSSSSSPPTVDPLAFDFVAAMLSVGDSLNNKVWLLLDPPRVKPPRRHFRFFFFFDLTTN